MSYSIVFIICYEENISPVRIKRMFRILLFSPLILTELTNYNNISYIYISSPEFRCEPCDQDKNPVPR